MSGRERNAWLTRSQLCRLRPYRLPTQGGTALIFYGLIFYTWKEVCVIDCITNINMSCITIFNRVKIVDCYRGKSHTIFIFFYGPKSFLSVSKCVYSLVMSQLIFSN